MNIRTVINAHAANPEGALQFAQSSRDADIVAVAPYFFYSLPKGLPLAERIATLFRRTGDMRQIAAALPAAQRELAVYEVNLHTIEGDATTEERKPVVAGIASGSALARTMLDTLALGARRQCVYTLTGFDAELDGRPGRVPLWGIARDLGPTQRLRPTGLALELMNQALAGDMVEVRRSGPADVYVYAFRSPRGWSAVVVSSAPDDRRITLHFPHPPGAPVRDTLLTLNRLMSMGAGATNEDSEGVQVSRESVPLLDSSVSLTLGPWSMAVLLPEKPAPEKPAPEKSAQ